MMPLMKQKASLARVENCIYRIAMCHRFANYKIVHSGFPIEFWDELPPLKTDGRKYNVAPTTIAPVIFGPSTAALMRWGLIPSFSRKIPNATLFNARSETLNERPSYRDLIGRLHAIIPMTCYFEWKTISGRKVPYMIHHATSDHALLVAGLWDRWVNPETQEEVQSFTILTREPLQTLAHLHNRMPVILDAEHALKWLALQTCIDKDYQRPLAITRISDRINSVHAQGPDLLQPVPDQLVPEQPELF